MSLTLQFEDEIPNLYVTKLLSQLQPHELVYQLNNHLSHNFIKEPNPFVINRKERELAYQWFTYKIDNETEHYIISNETYVKQTLMGVQTLFDESEKVETRYYLLPSVKTYNFHMLTLAMADEQILKQLQKKRIIQKFECLHLHEFKKTEQNILQNIYYEKQG